MAVMAALKRPDIELFIPESDVIATGSHAGVFSLAIERLRQELPGAKIRMIGHETTTDIFGYIVYAWIDR